MPTKPSKFISGVVFTLHTLHPKIFFEFFHQRIISQYQLRCYDLLVPKKIEPAPMQVGLLSLEPQQKHDSYNMSGLISRASPICNILEIFEC